MTASPSIDFRRSVGPVAKYTRSTIGPFIIIGQVSEGPLVKVRPGSHSLPRFLRFYFQRKRVVRRFFYHTGDPSGL